MLAIDVNLNSNSILNKTSWCTAWGLFPQNGSNSAIYLELTKFAWNRFKLCLCNIVGDRLFTVFICRQTGWSISYMSTANQNVHDNYRHQMFASTDEWRGFEHTIIIICKNDIPGESLRDLQDLMKPQYEFDRLAYTLCTFGLAWSTCRANKAQHSIGQRGPEEGGWPAPN